MLLRKAAQRVQSVPMRLQKSPKKVRLTTLGNSGMIGEELRGATSAYRIPMKIESGDKVFYINISKTSIAKCKPCVFSVNTQ